jgi:hypothetical protein
VTTLEILKAARELLAVPERWTKGAFGRDSNDLSRFLLSVHKAVCFCSQGAIESVQLLALDQAKEIAALFGFATWSQVWNDAPERTHAEVLARFDEAIAKLEEKVC